MLLMASPSMGWMGPPRSPHGPGFGPDKVMGDPGLPTETTRPPDPPSRPHHPGPTIQDPLSRPHHPGPAVQTPPSRTRHPGPAIQTLPSRTRRPGPAGCDELTQHKAQSSPRFSQHSTNQTPPTSVLPSKPSRAAISLDPPDHALQSLTLLI